MAMSNKSVGNAFEREVCDILAGYGFWVHNFTQNKDGQPADIIAVKNGHAYLIDCKVCSTRKGFDPRRVEENQDLSMTMWHECGNGEGWFAVKIENLIYMISHSAMMNCKANNRGCMRLDDFALSGRLIGKWAKSCE